jgi:hypothetical protein
MSEKTEADITVAARVPEALYAKILRRQKAISELTGIEPSVSAVVRSMIGEAKDEAPRRRRAMSAV